MHNIILNETQLTKSKEQTVNLFQFKGKGNIGNYLITKLPNSWLLERSLDVKLVKVSITHPEKLFWLNNT